jgi:hypothetical protein
MLTGQEDGTSDHHEPKESKGNTGAVCWRQVICFMGKAELFIFYIRCLPPQFVMNFGLMALLKYLNMRFSRGTRPEQ